MMVKAMILAAGEGQRLRPLTLTVPKVLVPLDGIPLINYHLQWLKKHSIFDVVINLHYLGFKIEDYLGDGSRFGVRIVYSREEYLLGTAGGVKRVADLFDTTFVVLYGDVLTNLNLSKMIEFHKEKGAIATLVLHKLNNIVGKGVVTIDELHRILSFEEKPSIINQSSKLVSGGVYILNRDVLACIDEANPNDFGADVFPRILQLGLPMYAYMLGKDDFLMDIGNFKMYHKANRMIVNKQERFHLD